MKVAIVGSREYPDLAAVRRYIYTLPQDTVIISGGARGVDRVAVTTARERGMRSQEILAEWDLYGKRAGYLRNELVVEAADRIIVFWNGSSPGSLHVIHLAQKKQKPYEVIRPD